MKSIRDRKYQAQKSLAPSQSDLRIFMFSNLNRKSNFHKSDLLSASHISKIETNQQKKVGKNNIFYRAIN